MCFELNVLRNGRWRDVFTDCYRMSETGRVRIYVFNIPTGERGRIRASFHSAPNLLGDSSKWGFFTMTS